MDLLKLLTSLEDLVVEIALWIILLPRTLFGAIFTPVRLAKYFDEVEAIPARDRDDRYLSPVLFWILTAPVSLVIMLWGADQRAFAMYGADWKERIGTSALMLLGPPLGFALATVLVQRQVVSRLTLRRQFSLQCYYHAPMGMIFVLSTYLRIRFGDTPGTLLSFFSLIWFCAAEYRIANRAADRVHAAGTVALGCALAFFLMLAIGLSIWLLLFLSGRFNPFG